MVELVDEGQDRHVAQPADLEELAGLFLDAPFWRHWGGVEHHHRAVDLGQDAVGVLSWLKSRWAEILVARRVEQVEGEPLMLEAHHRRGDGDAALALDRHPIRAHPPPSPRASTSPANRIAPPSGSNFSVNVFLPASECEIIANVRRRKIGRNDDNFGMC